ncbi:hypothetical protein FRB96_000313 [Tulasnella sp. 330]|nr:hypothetical protein FRB96_000313 [Tulasnella sp. 330]
MLATSLISLAVSSSALVASGPTYMNTSTPDPSTYAAVSDKGNVKVPITLGVMSRCPDALFCEEVFDSVLDEVGFDKVDVTLSFIARFDGFEPKYGIKCMHGVQECDGNVQELCTSKHRGGSKAVAEWWPWLQCFNAGGLGNVGNVGRARECAEMSGFDWDDGSNSIAECAKGSEGVELLKESVKNTQALEIQWVQRSFAWRGKAARSSSAARLDVCMTELGKIARLGGHSVSELAQSINDEYARLNHHSDSQDWWHRSSLHLRINI